MTPIEVYKDYLALRSHFNSDSYDYFKYGGKVRYNTDTFRKTKDQFSYEKIAKHCDPHSLMLSNFVKNCKPWIHDIAYSSESEQTYIDWKKRKESLTYNIKNDLDRLKVPFDDNFIITDNQHSHLLVLLLGRKISLETVCVLVELSGCYHYWNRELKNDIIWKEVGRTIKKYTPFIAYDKEKVKKIVVDFFE